MTEWYGAGIIRHLVMFLLLRLPPNHFLRLRLLLLRFLNRLQIKKDLLLSITGML